ncbi:MAG: SufE family protein [Armatimonadota bacterium]|nr:SufE family protein [Armatimonadota bacterium]
MSDRPLPPALQERIDFFSHLDRGDRIEALISIADRFRAAPPSVAPRPYDEAHRVPACESEAFVWAVEQPDGTLDFHFVVENPQGVSAKAMAVILGETVSGAPLDEVANLSDDVVYGFFGNELSMGKTMGLTSMVGMVRGEAKKRHTP